MYKIIGALALALLFTLSLSVVQAPSLEAIISTDLTWTDNEAIAGVQNASTSVDNLAKPG